MKKTARKVLATVLSVALIAGVSTVAKRQGNQNIAEAQIAQKPSVYDEIETVNVPEKELKEIGKVALSDGRKAAEKVNAYETDADFDAALNSALTAYYQSEEFSQMNSFEKALDKRGAKCVKGYESAAKERAKGDKNGFKVGEILAVFDADTSKEEMEAVCKAEYGELDSYYDIYTGEHVATIKISLGQTVDVASDKYEKYCITEAADRNDYQTVCDVPTVNDPKISEDYKFENMKIKGAWDFIQNKEHQKVLVAVIDNGIDVNHPDLVNVMSPDSVDYSSTEPVPLKDVNFPSSRNHGTAVAGTIAAEANNGEFSVGTGSGYDNSNIEILGIHAGSTTDEELISTNAAIRGLDYAQRKGAKVVNMSFGSYYANTSEETIIKRMTNAGMICVASAGNDTKDELHYPSDFKEVISVAATDSANKLAYFSNYGPEKDICAPGYNVKVIVNNSGYRTWDGTSFSSPAVAGVVGMMKSVNSKLNYYDVMRIMANTATTLGDNASKGKVKYGVVNAEESVKTAYQYDPNMNFGEVGEVYDDLRTDARITASREKRGMPVALMIDKNDDTMGGIDTGDRQYVTIEFSTPCRLTTLGVIYRKEMMSGKVCFASSDDGVNFEDYGYMITGMHKGGYDYFTSDKVIKYLRIEFLNCTESVDINEIKLLGYRQQSGVRDVFDMEEDVQDPFGLEVYSIGDGKVRAEWKTTENVKTKDYVFEVSSTNLTGGPSNYGTTTKNYMDIENCPQGYSVFNVRAIYKGKYSKYINCTYQTPVETTVQNYEYVLSNENIAQGKTAVASSSESEGMSAGKAIDGNAGTRWASAFTDNEWIYVDLGSQYDDIAKVDIDWEAARAKDYKIEVSSNGGNWTTVKTVNNNNSNNTSDSFERVSARYVRIAGIQRATGYGYSIFEIKIYRMIKKIITDPTTVAPTTVPGTTSEVTTKEVTTTPETTTVAGNSYTISNENIALNKTASASSKESDGNSAAKAVDGDVGSRWSSAFTDNEWIAVDLGTNYPVAKVDIDWEAARAKDYKIETSVDGNNWTTVKTINDNNLMNTSDVFEPVTARYVRMKGVTRATGYGYSIFEIKVYPAIYSSEPVTTEPTTEVPTEEPTTRNLGLVGNGALGKPATASSSESDGMSAAKAFDGDLGTRWASNWNDNEWISVDLGATKQVYFLDIHWETAFALTYEVYASTDGENWNLVNTYNSTGGHQEVTAYTKARYIKLVGTHRATNYGISIYEMAVMSY